MNQMTSRTTAEPPFATIAPTRRPPAGRRELADPREFLGAAEINKKAAVNQMNQMLEKANQAQSVGLIRAGMGKGVPVGVISHLLVQVKGELEEAVRQARRARSSEGGESLGEESAGSGNSGDSFRGSGGFFGGSGGFGRRSKRAESNGEMSESSRRSRVLPFGGGGGDSKRSSRVLD